MAIVGVIAFQTDPFFCGFKLSRSLYVWRVEAGDGPALSRKPTCAMVHSPFLDWVKGTYARNHGFSRYIKRFPVNFPMIQFWDI